MVRERLSSGALLLAPIMLLGIMAWRLGAPLPVALAAPALPGSADDQLTVAADRIAQRTAAGGAGFTFTVVSRSTLYAKEGGPLIEVPDPIDRYKTLGLASDYYLGASIASGTVTPDGYFLQMYAGPATADAPVDFEKSPATLAALVKQGATWRNDGDGWYRTDQPPGIGLDPATIALLPTFLRDAGSPEAKGARLVDGAAALAVEATGEIAKAPGLMAIDAASFTVLAAPLSFALDDQGRLVEIRAVMRNTRSEVFELLVETIITIRYPETAPILPAPAPLYVEPGSGTDETGEVAP